MTPSNPPVSPRRILIVGGVAGGASCAARLRRQDEFADITVIERGGDVSFANCGLPYYIGGEITDRSKLALQTPKSLEALLGLKVRVRTEALSIDRAAKILRVRDLANGLEEDLAYDQLVLAPGAMPLRPPLPGIDDPRILTLRTLPDMDAIRALASQAKQAVVIGAGFIGLEMAEQLVHLGVKVSLVEMQPQVLPQLDPDMTRFIEDSLRDHGVNLMLGESVQGFRPGETLGVQLASGEELAADLVLLSIGVRPENGLAKAAGLTLGPRGHIVVNGFLQSSDPNIYAVGDVVEHLEPIFGRPAAIPLGGLANRQGRVAADHIVHGDRAVPYPGSLGTSIVRVFDRTAAVSGWTEKRLRAEKIPYRSTVVHDMHHASYYPDAKLLSVKILWSPDDGRLIGAQVVGEEGVDKRMDVLATAMIGRLTIDQLSHLELAYAPPFGSAKDPVNLAGFNATNLRDGLYVPYAEGGAEAQWVDVRPKAAYDKAPTPGTRNIPLAELRARCGELDRNKPVVTLCAMGKTSYFAARILGQRGFQVSSVVGGLRLSPR
jgi:NADPH-dependent 2,4-dienoyl-CoA reductase/sulfur reductase-like enzyme/rhodanese-related sulfurtransferase